MCRYQTNHRILSLLLVLALLILPSAMFFPSQAAANAGVWIWPSQIIVNPDQDVCGTVDPAMDVQKLVIELADQLWASFAVELFPGGPMEEYIMLEYDGSGFGGGFWSSPTGHTITSLGSRVEVSFEPPLPDVDQFCVWYVDSWPEEEIVIDLLQLVPPPPEDFGDAPDPTYPTLLIHNGARHQITGLFLGAGVDSEPDGQPETSAMGDDLDGDGDDEDGVTFITSLIPGNTADVSVVASASGFLDAWLDINGDGDWSDAGEQILANQPLVAGVNNLSFEVHAGAVSGTTFARFRVSSSGGLSVNGFAADGEVEDYEVTISEPEPGSGWIWPGPIIVNPDQDVCGTVDPAMDVQKLVIELADQLWASFAVELFPGGPMEEYIMLEYDSRFGGGFWSSPTGHAITSLGSRVEVSLEPPLPDVDQFCVWYVDSWPEEEIVIDLLQLIPPSDFGDTPDPTYPTLLANNGARHQQPSALFLGFSVDSEPDGQPDAVATGDDLDSDGDDEDGVTFIISLIPGNTADVSVVASAAGLLDAWVDFNGNGDWSGAGEQIFTSEPLAVGANNLSFSVPAGAASGTTFARFRVSSNGGLSFDGFAFDGEVEDYQVSISEAELGSISGMKFDDSNGNSAKDPGEAGIPVWAIQLKDGSGILIAETVTGPGGEYSFFSLDPGTYQVHEALPLGWTQTVPGGAGYHEVTLSSGQNVQDVDFGNQYIGEPPVLEVGGMVYPADKLTMLALWILLAVAMIVGVTIALKRRRA